MKIGVAREPLEGGPPTYGNGLQVIATIFNPSYSTSSTVTHAIDKDLPPI